MSKAIKWLIYVLFVSVTITVANLIKSTDTYSFWVGIIIGELSVYITQWAREE